MAFAAARVMFNPFYSSPHCSMRLVHQSNPALFSAHPLWRSLVYDNSCAGERLDDYISAQNDLFEGSMQVALTGLFSLASIIWIALEFRDYANFEAAIGGVIGLISTTVLLMHTHFEQDVVYMTGALMHESDPGRVGMNVQTGSLSQGYLICGLANRVFYSAGILALARWDTKLRIRLGGLRPGIQVALVNLGVHLIAYQVKNNHPHYHAIATPAMAHAWPYTTEYRAYSHVITHHTTGKKFAGDFFLDPLFDTALVIYGWLHNEVLGLHLGTVSHHVFAMAFDAILGGVCLALIWMAMRLGACAVELRESKRLPKKVQPVPLSILKVHGG